MVRFSGDDRRIEESDDIYTVSEISEALRQHLESHSPIACTAYIVRPPCNPQATSVTPKIELPDWVNEVRCY